MMKQTISLTPGPSSVPYGNFDLEGLGPDAITVTTPDGGKQSNNPYAAEMLPPLAIARVCKVLKQGKDKYGEWNWTNIKDISDHIGKAHMHVFAFTAGDTQEGEPSEHIAHAICRLLFALDLIERSKQNVA